MWLEFIQKQTEVFKLFISFHQLNIFKTINKPINTGHNETKRKHYTKLKPTDGLVQKEMELDGNLYYEKSENHEN